MIFLEKTAYLKIQNQSLRDLILISFLTTILAISAQISIPWQPIPLTFQSATVLLIASLSEAKISVRAVCAYLIAGSVGLPIFSKMNAGIGVLFGYTGGYLIGFLPAAWITSTLSQFVTKRTLPALLIRFIIICFGAMIIFFSGTLALTRWFSWHVAYALGVAPFLWPELIKLFVVSSIATYFHENHSS